MLSSMEAAPPVLGSILLRASENHDLQRPAPANCGSAAIDDCVLTGGFRYGEVTALSGADGVGKRLVWHNATDLVRYKSLIFRIYSLPIMQSRLIYCRTTLMKQLISIPMGFLRLCSSVRS